MDVELTNLSTECGEFEQIVVGTKVYRLFLKNDEVLFSRVAVAADKNHNKNSHEDLLKIKQNEILFVRKGNDRSTEPRRCCLRSSRQLSVVVDHKHLRHLLLVEGQVIDPNKASIQAARYANNKDSNENPCGRVLNVYHVKRMKGCQWRVAQINCTYSSNVARDRWEHVFQNLISSAVKRPKRLLVFVNPFGGRGRASDVYKKYVDSLFRLCDINVSVITTQRANHARDVCLENDLSEFDGVVSVGGDGLFNEVMNGLLIRTQKDANLNINDRDAMLQQPRLKLAAIPAGSTNAFAYTVHGTDDPLTAVLHAVVGDKRGVDVCSVHCGDEFHTFACTAVAYGYLGEVLKDSEQLRRLGPPRYLVSGMKMAIRHPWYAGRIELMLNKDEINVNKDGSPSLVTQEVPLQKCHSKCGLCKEGSDEPSSSAIEHHSTLNEEFLHLVGIITPCLCKLSPSGLSPTCHLGDGTMHLAVVARVSRLRNMSFIWKVMGKRADHLDQRYVKLRKIQGFSFTPRYTLKLAEEGKIADKDEKVDLGTWNIDGELVPQPNGAIYFKMHRQLIDMFGRGIEVEDADEWESKSSKFRGCCGGCSCISK